MSETLKPPTLSPLREVIALFLRLGTTAFGGPAAHIAMMHDEVVTRKKWLSDQEFLDLNGATNLIPGPNSTELAIHLGYVRAGWRGLIAAGVSFILPAMLIVMVLAWAYVQYGTTPQADALFYGIQPVIIVIIAQALWLLGRKAIKNAATAVVGVTAVVLYLFGFNEILLLILAGLIIVLVENANRLRKNGTLSLLIPFSIFSLSSLYQESAIRNQPSAINNLQSPISNSSLLPPLSSLLSTSSRQSFSLAVLFLSFLKIGSVLYGSGYVLLAFLHDEFVQNLGWLTEKQLLDAVAIGQITPGPVFTTATFIGYLLGGVPGAVVATIGIFLPAFVFVAITNPFIPRMRQSKILSSILDGVNVASAGLMAGVTLQLASTAFIDVPTVLIGIVAAVLLFRFRVNPTWLVIGGAGVGLALALIRQ